MITSFARHPYAQARIITGENGWSYALRSYDTIVVEVDENGWMIVNGLYSHTTITHVGWFMRELGFSYADAKNLYNNNLTMNIFSGEVMERG